MGPSRDRGLLGVTKLRRSYELHRPGYLACVLRGVDAPPDVSLARHGASLALLRKERLAEFFGRGLEGHRRGVVERLGFGIVAHDFGLFGLEEAVELQLEVFDTGRRHIVE